MRSRMLILLAVVPACTVASSVGVQPATGAAGGATRNPCALISKARLASILGIRHIEEHATIGPHYPKESDGRVASSCLVKAWRGARATRPKQAEEEIASEAAAELDITTFVTDTAAPSEVQQAWVGAGKGYDRELTLTKASPRFLLGVLNYAHGLHGVSFSPPRLGAEHSEGFQYALSANGLPRPIRTASAYWADDSSHSILGIGLIEGTRASAVRKRLDKLGKAVVPAFGL